MGPDQIFAGSALTIAIAPVVGAYLSLSAIGMLGRDRAARFLFDLSDRPASLHAVGAVAFLVGAGILTLHRHWAAPAEIVLNLVAAWWAFEGAGMLADPERVRRLLSAPRSALGMRLSQLPGLLTGLYLLATGAVGKVI